jgi:hypothetical protein
VFTERYTAIDHLEVLSQMLQYGFDPAAEVRLALDQEVMVLQVPDRRRAFGGTDGDRIVSYSRSFLLHAALKSLRPWINPRMTIRSLSIR